MSGKKNIHFVGVGGIGMSAIAHVLIEMGHTVSGSDLHANNITRKLESIGGRMLSGHRTSNIPKAADILVYSSSISGENPEMAEAARRKITVVHRAEMLGQIFNGRNGIAVTGTHGKTTTTSLIAVMLKNAGLDPTVMIGGEVRAFDGNARLGAGDHIVAEADESDSSFHHLRPQTAVITNIEMEHLDHFKTLANIHRSYRVFIGNMKDRGKVFYNRADANIARVLKGFKGKAESFGFSKEADMYPLDVRMDGFNTSFVCVYRGAKLGRIALKIPGRHNILNAMAAVLVGLDLGLPFGTIGQSIGDFEGARRRFQLRADRGGVMLVDDYAHHPTEIRAVLDACRNWKDKRLIAIFQPHRYTRTKFFADAFGSCFKGVDKLILTDIYGASERAIKGVSVKMVYDSARKNGIRDVVMLRKEEVPGHVMKIKKPGDMILVLGAGDIKDAADALADMMGGLSRPEGRPAGSVVDELKGRVEGEVKVNESLSRRTSLKIGGAADIWVEPADIASLRNTIAIAKAGSIPFFIIGNGSNLLASDEGYRGIVISLGAPAFRHIAFRGTQVRVGAGFGLPKLVRACCEKALAGMESLVGIPGTVGGAICMNAGGYSNPIYKNIGSMVMSVRVMDLAGRVKTLRAKDIEFGYRSSNLGPYIILETLLKLRRGNSRDLIDSCSRFLRMKRDKQVLDEPNAGCIFKNPKGFHFTCGQMIDMLNLKGKRIGGAEISDKHANFIINKDAASQKDVMDLIGFIRDKVKANYDIDLELEVKVI